MRFPGFIGPSYVSQSVNVDCQRCVNLFTEINPLGTGKEREVASLVSTPGKQLLLTLSESGMRGLWTASNGDLFAVAGQKVFKISSSWVETELGTINTLTGPVSIADNGEQVVFVDGADGWVYTIDTAVFAEITDPEFYPADQVTFLDGYFIFNRTDSQQFFYTDLNSVNFDALDIQSVEGSPDNLLGVRASNENLYLFGTQSIEVFYNSGDVDAPFARNQGAVIATGCAAPFTVQKLEGVLYFLGGDANGSGIVYRLQGYHAQRISTPSIEKVIRSIDPNDLVDATAFTYQQGGHLFYCLNLPGIDSTWVYDAATEHWHERAYLNLWSMERDRAECHAVAYGKNVVGDYENGKIYSLEADYCFDDTTPIKRIRAAPHFSENLKSIRHNSFQLDMETGVGLDGTTQGTNPQVMLRWSDDGGHSWSNEQYADAGRIGQRLTRVIWRRLGSSRDRVYEVSITDPVKVVFIGAELEVEGGTS